MPKDNNFELKGFRRQWQEPVIARTNEILATKVPDDLTTEKASIRSPRRNSCIKSSMCHFTQHGSRKLIPKSTIVGQRAPCLEHGRTTSSERMLQESPSALSIYPRSKLWQLQQIHVTSPLHNSCSDIQRGQNQSRSIYYSTRCGYNSTAAGRSPSPQRHPRFR